MSIYLILIIVAAIVSFLTYIYVEFIQPQFKAIGFCPCNANKGGANENFCPCNSQERFCAYNAQEGFCPYAAAAAQSALGEGFCPCNSREEFCSCNKSRNSSSNRSEGFVGDDYKARADYLSKKFSTPANQNKLESYTLYSKVIKDGDSAEWYDLVNLKRGGIPITSDNIYAKFISK